jgi:4-nitrophenyl phosphatase
MPDISPNIKGLILDMDGVLWKGDTPIGDLPAIFARIDELGLKTVFATNNGTRSPRQYVERLAGFGVEIEALQVVTSSLCAAHLLKQRFPQGGPIFAVGEQGVIEALREQNFEALSLEDAPGAQALVMGLDRQISFEKMREATLLVRAGKPFYATNPDKTFPTPRGEIPGAGAWMAVVSTATGVEPIYAGKPFPFIIELALERLGLRKEEALVVGDRLDTDIAAGQAFGAPCALVLSGVSTREQAEAWRPQIDVIAESLEELVGKGESR